MEIQNKPLVTSIIKLLVAAFVVLAAVQILSNAHITVDVNLKGEQVVQQVDHYDGSRAITENDLGAAQRKE